MRVGNSNQFVSVSRNIILRNEREPASSLKEIQDAATKVPSTIEENQKIQKPMKELQDAMRQSWIM